MSSIPANCKCYFLTPPKADGTPYLSGTEWEYLEALDAAQRSARPEILLYRRTEKCLLDPDDPQFADNVRQRESVKRFFAAFRNPDGSIKRACNEYEKPEDFRQKLDQHLKAIIGPWLRSRAARAAGPAESAAPAAALPLWQGSPFPGLRAFTPDDAPIFFGRGRETDELVRRLADAASRFVAWSAPRGRASPHWWRRVFCPA